MNLSTSRPLFPLLSSRSGLLPRSLSHSAGPPATGPWHAPFRDSQHSPSPLHRGNSPICFHLKSHFLLRWLPRQVRPPPPLPAPGGPRRPSHSCTCSCGALRSMPVTVTSPWTQGTGCSCQPRRPQCSVPGHRAVLRCLLTESVNRRGREGGWLACLSGEHSPGLLSA